MKTKMEIPGELLHRLASDLPIIYPTSTLPALGCRPTESALDRLFELKRRRQDQIVSLAVASLRQAEELVRVPDELPEFLAAHPAGALTVILAAHKRLDSRLGGLDVAIRPVCDPRAAALLTLSGPLTATSANLSGRTAVDDCEESGALLGLPTGAILPGLCAGGAPSTLIRWNYSDNVTRCAKLEVLRAGVVSEEAIQAWLRKQT